MRRGAGIQLHSPNTNTTRWTWWQHNEAPVLCLCQTPQWFQCLSPFIPNSGKSIWGSSGILKGECWGASCCCRCSASRPLSLGRLNIPFSVLPTALKGWFIPSLTFKISLTSDSCHDKVRKIIAERRQWVIKFCLFTCLSSLMISSLLISAPSPPNWPALSPSVSTSPTAEELASSCPGIPPGCFRTPPPSNDSNYHQ